MNWKGVLYKVTSDKSCENRIKEAWANTIKDWNDNQKDKEYLDQSFILCVDYVQPHTFQGQKRGYKRIQFSWGGPSDELRVFRTGRGIDKIEYWFMDWFDGAMLNVTKDEVANEIVEYYTSH